MSGPRVVRTEKGKNTAQAKENIRGQTHTNNLFGLQPRGLFEAVEEGRVPRAKS